MSVTTADLRTAKGSFYKPYLSRQIFAVHRLIPSSSNGLLFPSGGEQAGRRGRSLESVWRYGHNAVSVGTASVAPEGGTRFRSQQNSIFRAVYAVRLQRPWLQVRTWLMGGCSRASSCGKKEFRISNFGLRIVKVRQCSVKTQRDRISNTKFAIRNSKSENFIPDALR